MLKILHLSLITLAFFHISSSMVYGEEASKTNESSSEQQEGKNTNAKYHFDFPKDWKVKNKFAGTEMMGFAPSDGPTDQFNENINLMVESIPIEISLDKYYEASISHIKKMGKDVKVLEEGDVMIGDIPGKFAVITHTYEGMPLKVKSIILYKDKVGYAITCTASEKTYDKFKDQFDQISKSFRIK